MYGYFATSKTYSDIILGGHYRFTMSADGRETLDILKFSKSCLAVNPYEKGVDGAKVEAAFATHILTPYPQEHHVFSQRNTGISLFIGTASGETDRLYEIKSGKIRKVKK